MEFSSEHRAPWDLIISSLQNNISTEEDAQLQQWISSSDENQELFNQLKQIWAEELNDYAIYREADETVAWKALRLKLEEKSNEENANGNVVKGDFNKRHIKLIRWTSVAAIFVIMIGSFIWYKANQSGNIYQTGKNEQQTVLLSDGSSIKLYQNTRIEISKDYNKSDRVITFKRGEAFFEVNHNEQIPFVVDMGAASVKDIGTSFYIQNRNDSIKLFVKSGEAAFINNANNDTRELSAGMSLKFQRGKINSAPVILIDSASVNNPGLLHFENTELSDVILKLQEVYNKKIVFVDSVIANKKFTGHLDGQSIEEVMNILSKSLNIKYFTKNGVYYLKKE